LRKWHRFLQGTNNMIGRLQVIKSTLSTFNSLVINEVTLRHLEVDKILVRSPGFEFPLWPRNIIFEENQLRLNGFVLYKGIMGQVECVITLGG